MLPGIPLELLASFVNDDEASPFDYFAPEALANVGTAPAVARPAASMGGALTPDAQGYYGGRGSLFATPQDLSNYRRTGSFATGDNGRGYFGGVNTAGDVPYVAVPRDLLDPSGRPDPKAAFFAEVITPKGQRHVVRVGDVMPRVANRANDAVIDINPAAARLFGTGDMQGYRWRLLPNPTAP